MGILAATAAMGLAACTDILQTAYGAPAADVPLARVVQVETRSDLHRDPPVCAVVLPATGLSAAQARAVESALARQLSGRLPQVIGPRTRAQLVRSLAVDLSVASDRRVFARAARCAHAVSVRPWGGSSSHHLVVWAQERVGLDVALRRIDDDALLWRARHVATRSEGGVPLSPLSAIFETAAATRFSLDPDMYASVLEDAARRIVATLPMTVAH